AVSRNLYRNKFHMERRPYPLHWLFADLPESGPQCLMAADDLVDALLQSCNAEVTFNLDRQVDVVQVAFRIKLLQEPQSLLGKRQWGRIIRVRAWGNSVSTARA